MSTIKYPYTRTPKGTEHPLTVGTAADLQVDDDGGKWVVLCDDHGTLVNVDTKAVALGVTALDFCDFCRDEANGVSDMSTEFEKEADMTDQNDNELTAEQAAEVDEALAHASAVIAAAEQVVADHAVETNAEHEAILAELRDAVNNVVRDAAIIKGAEAGIRRRVLAEAAGLSPVRIGRILKNGGSTVVRERKVPLFDQGYQAALQDVRDAMAAGSKPGTAAAKFISEHLDKATA